MPACARTRPSSPIPAARSWNLTAAEPASSPGALQQSEPGPGFADHVLIVIRPEQPDLREAAARTAGIVARIGIFADIARDVVPIGAVAQAARLAGLVIVAALGPAFTPLHPAPFGRGALHV